MSRIRRLVAGFVGAVAVWALGSGAALGVDVALVPISASGAHGVAGNEITLESGGQRIFLELQISNWDPDMDGIPLLQAYQLVVESAGYSSGVRGVLIPAVAACAGPDNCEVAFGGTCSLLDDPCNVDTDCQLPQFGEVCEKGPECTTDGLCVPGFILVNRADFVFVGTTLLAVDVTTLNYRFAASSDGASIADTGQIAYAGTLVLDVPANAMGTFTIGFRPPPISLLQDANTDFITPVNITPALITIPCNVPADCDDGDACTIDDCQPDRTCSNTPNFNPALDCCNPQDGVLTPLDDGNECTVGVCDPATGGVTQSPLPGGTSCGNPAAGACDAQDTCDGAGLCVDRSAPTGTACGNPGQTECDNPDTCDGTGTCQPNFVGGGTACGNPAQTECDNPDTCDGGGACQANFVASGTACGNPAATGCDDPDSCDGAGGCAANLKPSGTVCRAPAGLCDLEETCDGVSTACPADALATPGTVCRASGGACDPEEVCDGASPSCPTDNLEPLGTVCRASAGSCDPEEVCDGLSAPCPADSLEPMGTECRASLGACDPAETCTGASPACPADALEAAGTECRASAGLCDPAEFCSGTAPTCPADAVEAAGTECRASTGQCDPNEVCDGTSVSCPADAFEPGGTACGDPANTQCDNPDTCDGAGACRSNFEPGGTACGDPTATPCDNPDTCDGGGSCQSNFVSFGTACGNPAPTDCDNPDSCDGAGACAANPKPDGLACTADVNDCTDDVCLAGLCTHPFSAVGTACGDPAVTDCDNADTCDGAGGCASNPAPDGLACTPDANDCTADRCLAGVCDHPAEPLGTPCGDPADTDCDNPDTCDAAATCLSNFEPAGLACGSPADTQCDNPDTCSGAGACDSNFEPDGTVCDDQNVSTTDDACTSGTCVGVLIPQTPIVEPLGPRHLLVTAPPGNEAVEVALRVTSPDFPCLLKFVNATGLLVDVPLFQPPSAWGTITVRGTNMAPNTVYEVAEVCCGTVASPAASARTSIWGDVVGVFDQVNNMWTPPNNEVDIRDLVAMLGRFAGRVLAPPLGQVDIMPCNPDRIIDILRDLVNELDAFSGKPYPCPLPCVP